MCECGQFHANKGFQIRIYWQGRRWSITVDEDGRAFTDYAHAERALGIINNQIENSLDPTCNKPGFNPEYWANGSPRNLIWENYLAAYLEREARRLLPERKATHDIKRARLAHTTWLNGRTIREITAGVLQDFAALPCLKLALAPKTRADLVAYIGQVLRDAYTREELARVPKLPVVYVPKKRKRWLNQEQQQKILEHIPIQHRPIFLFLMSYGVRPAAACALCWDYIDLENQEFTIARTWSRRLLMDKPKTADYALPIFDWFAGYLASIPTGIGKTPVFINPDADRKRNPAGFYLPDFLTSLWRDSVVAADFQPIRLYEATKHSLGNQLRRQGWDYDAIASLLGITPAQVRRSYVEDDLDLLREKMKATITRLDKTN